MKTACAIIILFVLSYSASSQTYDVCISNRKLISARIMEFDVFIKSTGSTAPWAFRLYQSGYRFGAAFVNGGTLTASYVAGSSELESSFGKTWGFSYNAANRILNQSSNVGSVCPGAIVANTPRRIGTFRVTNTVNWGCADDSMNFVTSGSGYLSLSIGKYNSTDCSNPYSSLITAGARSFTESPGTAIRASSNIRLRCDSAEVQVLANGGLSPYSGTGVFNCGSGIKAFDVSDSRGCTAMVSDTISITPLSSSFSVTTCDAYHLPWSDTPVTTSGDYFHAYISSIGCDSLVAAHVTIHPNNSSVSFDTIPASLLPFYWNGISCASEGNYQALLKNQWGCDSAAILFLFIKGISDTCSPGRITSTASNDTICAGTTILLNVQGSLPAGAYWNWYENDCANETALGSGPSISVSPAETTTYFVKAQGVSCGTTPCAWIKTNVKNRPEVPASITGPNSGLCLAQHIMYAVNPDANACNWQWHVPGGVFINYGQGTPSVSVSFSSSLSSGPNTSATNICVGAYNKCGWSDYKCSSISLRPALTSEISGPAVLQKGQSVIYQTDSVFGANRYSWTVPAGWRIINGQYSRSVTVKAGGSGGNIGVTPSNSCGEGNSVSRIVSLWDSKSKELKQEEMQIIKVWPNPTSGVLFLKAGISPPDGLEVIDLKGSVLIKTTWLNELDLSHLIRGIYFLKVSKKGYSGKKIVFFKN